jgi:hypothetical protein
MPDEQDRRTPLAAWRLWRPRVGDRSPVVVAGKPESSQPLGVVVPEGADGLAVAEESNREARVRPDSSIEM